MLKTVPAKLAILFLIVLVSTCCLSYLLISNTASAEIAVRKV